MGATSCRTQARRPDNTWLFKSRLAGWRVAEYLHIAGFRKTVRFTPAIADGRVKSRPLMGYALKEFQSTPAIAGGRAQAHRRLAQGRQVSIRARHCWRASRKVQQTRCLLQPFQSAPAIAGGRARRSSSAKRFGCWRASRVGAALLKRGTEVSIRARHCWRASPRCTRPLRSLALFESAPAIAGGRADHSRQALRSPLLFQSAPAIAGGRANVARTRARVPWRFNPRPPLLAGEPPLPA